jgi:hypothetical protein
MSAAFAVIFEGGNIQCKISTVFAFPCHDSLLYHIRAVLVGCLFFIIGLANLASTPNSSQRHCDAMSCTSFAFAVHAASKKPKSVPVET